MLSFNYYYVKMTNLNVLCIKIRFIVIKIKVAIKKLHIPNLVINFSLYARDTLYQTF